MFQINRMIAYNTYANIGKLLKYTNNRVSSVMSTESGQVVSKVRNGDEEY